MDSADPRTELPCFIHPLLAGQRHTSPFFLFIIYLLSARSMRLWVAGGAIRRWADATPFSPARCRRKRAFNALGEGRVKSHQAQSGFAIGTCHVPRGPPTTNSKMRGRKNTQKTHPEKTGQVLARRYCLIDSRRNGERQTTPRPRCPPSWV